MKKYVLILITVMMTLAFVALGFIIFHLCSYRSDINVKHQVEIVRRVTDYNKLTESVICQIENSVARDSSEVAYREAEANLREHLDSWLAFLGIFGLLFGLIAPLASYLLQQRSLEGERERMEVSLTNAKKDCEDQIKEAIKQFEKDIGELKKTAKEDIKAAQEESIEDTKKKLKPVWLFLAMSMDKNLIDDKRRIEEVMKVPSASYNFIVLFILYCDVAVVLKNSKMISDVVSRFKECVNKIMENEELAKKIGDFSKADSLKSYMTYDEYAQVLVDRPDVLLWLKGHFDKFQIWKEKRTN